MSEVGEYPPAYYRETPGAQKAWRLVDELLETPPRRLEGWLLDQGIEVLPRRHSCRRDLMMRLHDIGHGGAASEFLNKTRMELISWNITTMPKSVCREIAWRLLEFSFIDPQPKVKAARKRIQPPRPPGEVEGMDFIPEWMRWVLLHPGLCAGEAVTDAVIQEAIQQYLNKSPCPHQGAQNMYYHLQQDPKAGIKLWSDCLRYSQQAKKEQADEEEEVEISLEEALRL